MKENYINVVFIIDESGSMYTSKEDVVGGFKKIIDEQKQVKEGKCTVSLYTFENTVKEIYLSKDVNEIEEINYNPSGCTAMNDAIGIAITNVGRWLNNMKEEEKPSKTMVVIMTDGLENASKEYTLSQVQEMIKHQTDKYNWDFIYIGADVTTATAADSLGINNRMFTSKACGYKKTWDTLNYLNTSYRSCACSMDEADLHLKREINVASASLTEEYEKELGRKIN